VRFAGDGREFQDMLKNLGLEQRNCLAKAEEYARKVAGATTEQERLQYRRLEQSYLTLAQSYEFSERLLDFTKENSRKLKSWFKEDESHGGPFFARNQHFIAPTRCERCGEQADVMHRTSNPSRPRFEVRIFECKGCGHFKRQCARF